MPGRPLILYSRLLYSIASIADPEHPCFDRDALVLAAWQTAAMQCVKPAP
jgi:hypothetical protein